MEIYKEHVVLKGICVFLITFSLNIVPQEANALLHLIVQEDSVVVVEFAQMHAENIEQKDY